MRSFRKPYQSVSAEGEALAPKSYANEVAEADGVPELLRAADAQFYGNSTVPDFDALPRDGPQLLNCIHKVTAGGGNSADGAALGWIADTLRTGVTPVDVRAALYEEAAGIPGSRSPSRWPTSKKARASRSGGWSRRTIRGRT